MHQEGFFFFTWHEVNRFLWSHLFQFSPNWFFSLPRRCHSSLHSASWISSPFAFSPMYSEAIQPWTRSYLLWKFSHNSQKNNNPCLGFSIRAAWKPLLGYYTPNREQGSVSRGHSGCDFTWQDEMHWHQILQERKGLFWVCSTVICGLPTEWTRWH